MGVEIEAFGSCVLCSNGASPGSTWLRQMQSLYGLVQAFASDLPIRYRNYSAELIPIRQRIDNDETLASKHGRTTTHVFFWCGVRQAKQSLQRLETPKTLYTRIASKARHENKAGGGRRAKRRESKPYLATTDENYLHEETYVSNVCLGTQSSQFFAP